MGARVKQAEKDQFMRKLKRWREQTGRSQSEAAEHLGVPLKTLQNWEIARTRPTALALGMLLALFGKKRLQTSTLIDTELGLT